MEQLCNILFTSCLLLCLTRGQYAQSPCPENFEYKNDESGVYGLVTVFPREYATSITTKINFTVATRLLSGYLGRIEPLGANLALIQQFNNGQPINFKLHFPVTSPLPRITSISVNDEVVCAGPGDSTWGGGVVTNVGLQHTLYLKGSGSTFVDSPKPMLTFGQGQGFLNFINENENFRPSWSSNSEPFFLINNSEVDIGDGFRPQKPFNFNSFFNPTQNSGEPVTRRPPQQSNRPPEPIPTVTARPTERPPEPAATQARPAVDNNECGVNTIIDSVPLVYNGLGYNRGDWPWLVAIFKRKNIGLTYICSGTLISNRHVLTAAHCMRSKTTLTSILDIVVKVGVHNILDWADDDVTVSRVLSSAIIHESFNASTLANDILLLTFKKPVQFNTYIKAACLWSGNTDLNLISGVTGVVTGWGVSELGPSGTGEPRMVRMPVVSTATCRASKPDFHKLTSSTTLCAGDRNGAGPCLGDSGGGLYIPDKSRWMLRGIVSLSLLSQNGDMSCNLNDYIVFTDAAQFLPWINDNMRT